MNAKGPVRKARHCECFQRNVLEDTVYVKKTVYFHGASCTFTSLNIRTFTKTRQWISQHSRTGVEYDPEPKLDLSFFKEHLLFLRTSKYFGHPLFLPKFMFCWQCILV